MSTRLAVMVVLAIVASCCAQTSEPKLKRISPGDPQSIPTGKEHGMVEGEWKPLVWPLRDDGTMAEWVRAQNKRKDDLWFAMRSRVLTDQEWTEVKHYDYELLVQMHANGANGYMSDGYNRSDKEKLFMDGLRVQYEIVMAEKAKPQSWPMADQLRAYFTCGQIEEQLKPLLAKGWQPDQDAVTGMAICAILKREAGIK